MQDKHDVGVSFRHKPCTHHMALQTMHHENGVVHCVLYLFYFLALPFHILFIYSSIFYYNLCILQGKVYQQCLCYPGALWSKPPSTNFIIYPTTVVVRHLHVPIFPPFLLFWRFHGHDERMHLFQLESNDQQSNSR